MTAATALEERAAEQVAAHRAATTYAHRVIDELVAGGLPRPTKTTVRVEGDELALSLWFLDPDEHGAWVRELDTAGGVPFGPWRVGPVSAIVRVGRLAGLRAVLALEVNHETPAGPGAHPPAPAPQAQPRGEDDSERTGDHDTAGWRAAIENALAGAARTAARVNDHLGGPAGSAR